MRDPHPAQHGPDQAVQLDTARHLSCRNAISSCELEQMVAELRFHKALEAERIAYRALEVYERDVNDWTIAPDEAKEYSLLLNWLKWRRAMAEAKADRWASRLAHDRDLFRRGINSYWDWVRTKLSHEAARSEVALRRAQEDWAALELAARTGRGVHDPDRQSRLRAALRQAGVRYSEAMVACDNVPLDIIRAVHRSRLNLDRLTPRTYISLLIIAYKDAVASLGTERKQLACWKSRRPTPTISRWPCAGASRWTTSTAPFATSTIRS